MRNHRFDRSESVEMLPLKIATPEFEAARERLESLTIGLEGSSSELSSAF